MSAPGRRVASVIFGYVSFCGVLAIRLVAALAMCTFAWMGRISLIPPLICLLATLLIGIRSWFGADGAHQMNIIVLFALVIAAVPGGNSDLVTACLAFIAAQAGLSYLIAGLSKLTSPIWRSGAALPGIMSTEIYGHDGLFRILSRRARLARAGCWLTISLETAFVPLCLISPITAVVALCAMAAFHVGIAAVMGLNGFLVSFIATYPAIWYITGAVPHLNM